MRHLASRECQKNNVLYQSIEIGACNIIGDFGQPNFPVPLEGGTTGTFYYIYYIYLSHLILKRRLVATECQQNNVLYQIVKVWAGNKIGDVLT